MGLIMEHNLEIGDRGSKYAFPQHYSDDFDIRKIYIFQDPLRLISVRKERGGFQLHLFRTQPIFDYLTDVDDEICKFESCCAHRSPNLKSIP